VPYLSSYSPPLFRMEQQWAAWVQHTRTHSFSVPGVPRSEACKWPLLKWLKTRTIAFWVLLYITSSTEQQVVKLSCHFPWNLWKCVCFRICSISWGPGPGGVGLVRGPSPAHTHDNPNIWTSYENNTKILDRVWLSYSIGNLRYLSLTHIVLLQQKPQCHGLTDPCL